MKLSRIFTALAVLILVALGAAVFHMEQSRKDRLGLTILYTTDMHGAIASGKNCIGLDRIAVVKQQTPDSILVDGGDFLSGSLIARMSEGKNVVGMMRAAGYLATAAGNHEFDYTAETLEERALDAEEGDQSPFHILSANIYTADKERLLRPNVQVMLAGARMCLFGLTTPQTPELTAFANTEGLFFEDLVLSARQQVEEAKASGCDLIVALTHIGTDSFVPLSSVALAEAVPQIDVIIDGHSHQEFERRTAQGTLVLSAGSHGKALGKLTIYYDIAAQRVLDTKNELLHVDDVNNIPPDPELSRSLTELEKDAEQYTSVLVGHVSRAYEGNRNILRVRECALGNLCADAFRSCYDAQIGLVNSGSIHTGLNKGDVSLGNLMSMLPYDNTLVQMELSGKELHHVLEHGLSSLPEASGAFLQVSGLRMHVVPSAEKGRRIRTLTLTDGTVINADAVYSVVVNSFMAEGGDGYGLLKGKPHRGTVSEWQALEDYIRRHGSKGNQEGVPEEPRRIVFE